MISFFWILSFRGDDEKRFWDDENTTQLSSQYIFMNSSCAFTKTNLMNFDRASMREYFQSLNEKPFRGDQLIQWLHQYGVTDFDAMTNFGQKLRTLLREQATFEIPTIIREQQSKDGTRKWLMQLSDQLSIETVFIPELTRGTLCISSQVGCPLRCRFCTTGLQGFKRNLTVAEIIGQVWRAVRTLSEEAGRHDHQVTNVVFMGMGEPLLNFDAVVKAIALLEDDLAYGLSKYRVTLSTAGVVPAIERLAKVSDVSLAVSLHAPNNEIRDQIMPVNKQYSIEALMDVCRCYFGKNSKRKVAFEYIMIDGLNDRVKHARELVKLLQGIPCKVNLIPFNDQRCDLQPEPTFRASSLDTIRAFQKILLAGGVRTIVRKTRGADIDAACGQLKEVSGC